jgi:UDP-N-acetylmuramate dehydrogenase
MQFEAGRRLDELTTFGIGGEARLFVEVRTISELQEAILHCREQGLRFFSLGKGSNVLFDDRGFDGAVIHNKITFCEKSHGAWFVGAGYSFSLLGVQTAREGWTGLEFASGIPGSVGGAVYMNAGANGGETWGPLTEVVFVDDEGKVGHFPKKSLQWGYRFSSFQTMKGVIAAARFQLEPSQEARKAQLQIVDYRMKTQPYKAMSAGCIFRNPSPEAAGALIEKAGLKGTTIGGAQVSPMHANFIVNTGTAKAQDVLDLADLVRKSVREKTGVTLEMEIRVIPYDA